MPTPLLIKYKKGHRIRLQIPCLLEMSFNSSQSVFRADWEPNLQHEIQRDMCYANSNKQASPSCSSVMAFGSKIRLHETCGTALATIDPYSDVGWHLNRFHWRTYWCCGYSVIMVVVDRLSSVFCFVENPFTVALVAKEFISNVVHLHGVPISIVSNRNKVFINSFW